MKALLFPCVAALLMQAACEFGVTASKAAAVTCPDPQRGRRYSVCARLSTSASPGDGVDGDHVEGNLNAGTAAVAGKHHQILGGTFHASH